MTIWDPLLYCLFVTINYTMGHRVYCHHTEMGKISIPTWSPAEHGIAQIEIQNINNRPEGLLLVGRNVKKMFHQII